MQCQTTATLQRNDFVEVLPWFGTTGFLLMSRSSAARAADYSDDWFIPFVGDDVVAKCISI